MPKQPTPTRYRVLAPDLSYPTDSDVIARLVAGEDVPFADRSMKTVLAGEVVTDIPAVSLPWLLADGLIEEVGADG